jgi:tetratricopeptide (TPR) repeat protein
MKLVAVISFLTYILLGSPPLFADTGSLYVTSNPSGANISLDNNPTGKKTETFIENIPTGTHKITVEHAGYEKAEETIEIKSGLTTAVHLELQTQEVKGTADYHSRGFISLSKAQYDLAVADFAKAIEQNPNFMVAHYNRGVAYFELGKYDLAIADFTKAMKLGLKGKGSYYIRGLALCRAGQYDLAIKDFSNIIELDPADATAYTMRGVIYLLKKQYRQTVADFTKALELDPKKAAQYYFCLGFASDKGGDSDAARTHFLKARDIDKDIVMKQAELLETQVSRENKVFYGEAMLSASKYLNIMPPFVVKAKEILKSTPPLPLPSPPP